MKLGSKFYSRKKLQMKSTFTEAEIKIVCKMESFVHTLECIIVKNRGKIRESLDESETSSSLE